MRQIARNLTGCETGFLKEARHLIHDRDPLFTQSSCEIQNSSNVETVKLPARSPNLNAYAERFIRSIKSEPLAQIIPWGERYLRHAVKEYAEHCCHERNNQGLDNRLIEERQGVIDMSSAVIRHERRAAWTVSRVLAHNGVGRLGNVPTFGVLQLQRPRSRMS
jgi:hypothetical protein